MDFERNGVIDRDTNRMDLIDINQFNFDFRAIKKKITVSHELKEFEI